MIRVRFFFLLAFFLLFSTTVSSLSIVTHVPEKYVEVQAGERFYFDVDIKFPENPERIDLRLHYQIKKDGKLISESKTLKAVETQISFLDFIVIPESAKPGMYTISVGVSDYEDLSQEVSSTFYVTKSGLSGQLQIYFIILIAAIVIVGGLSVWEIHRLGSRRK